MMNAERLRRGLWVIVGGESGPGGRATRREWFTALRDQCQAAGVPFFMKQMGGHPSKRARIDEIPLELRVREWPHEKAKNE